MNNSSKKKAKRIVPALMRGPCGPGRQRGYTLVELSVAVLIGLFLMGGLLTMLQSTRAAFGNQNGLAQLQDNERFAMTLITDVVQAAGYFPDPVNNTAASILPISAPFAQAGQAVFGVESASAQGDTITVRYATANNDGVINCAGGTNTSGGPQTYVSVFSVNAQNQLQCVMNGAAPVILVNNVTNLQIVYGVQTNTALTGNNVDSYLPANLMTAANWSNVISVRVTLSFNNPLYGTPGQTAAASQFVTFSRIVSVMNKAGVQT